MTMAHIILPYGQSDENLPWDSHGSFPEWGDPNRDPHNGITLIKGTPRRYPSIVASSPCLQDFLGLPEDGSRLFGFREWWYLCCAM